MTDQFFKTREETQAWLDKMGVENYTIHDDLTVDVLGDVDISSQNMKVIPVQFGVVSHFFSCSCNKLTSLKGAPRECETFNCCTNRIISLENAPKECDYFICFSNRLTSLVGAPEEYLYFDCRHNPDLSDITAVSNRSGFRCDYDVVAKNRASRQLLDLDAENISTSARLRTKSDRLL